MNGAGLSVIFWLVYIGGLTCDVTLSVQKPPEETCNLSSFGNVKIKEQLCCGESTGGILERKLSVSLTFCVSNFGPPCFSTIFDNTEKREG